MKKAITILFLAIMLWMLLNMIANALVTIILRVDKVIKRCFKEWRCNT